MATSIIDSHYSKGVLGADISTTVWRYGHVGLIRFSVNDTIQTLLSVTIPSGFRPKDGFYIQTSMKISNRVYIGRVLINTDGTMRFYYVNGETETEITSGSTWVVYGSGAYII